MKATHRIPAVQDGPPPTDVRPVLARIAAGLGHSGPLGPELRLVEDLELDSVGLLTLAVEVEDTFRICLDAGDEAAIRTVGDLEAVIARKLAARATNGAPAGAAP